jgi:hypothetical protein
MTFANIYTAAPPTVGWVSKHEDGAGVTAVAALPHAGIVVVPEELNEHAGVPAGGMTAVVHKGNTVPAEVSMVTKVMEATSGLVELTHPTSVDRTRAKAKRTIMRDDRRLRITPERFAAIKGSSWQCYTEKTNNG